jgi:hypothetical protein
MGIVARARTVFCPLVSFFTVTAPRGGLAVSPGDGSERASDEGGFGEVCSERGEREDGEAPAGDG